MSLLSRARAAYRAFLGRNQVRGFDGARGGRLYADWFSAATSSDTEIRGSFRKLLDRSRDLERNNDYQRGFLGSCERNILGSVRMDLRMDCGEEIISSGKPTWQPDRLANSAIERAWQEWGKKGTCTVCGRFSWRDVKRLAVRAVPRDGNFLARKIKGPASGNKFGFALQIWEIDHLDLLKFETRADGTEIRFGIESNAMGRVTHFWLMGRHPGDISGGSFGSAKSIRVPADELYHLYIAERPEQSIGIPWVVSAITRLRQLGAFEEAAVIAARLGASKAIFFKKTPGPNGEMGEWTGTDDQGKPQMDVAPGTAEALPQGWDIANYDPTYPNIETGDFRKAMLRGVGTSLNMSYNTLGNDMESVNLSSARLGISEEREGWKSLQTFFSEGLWELIFADWLEISLVAGAIVLTNGSKLPIAKLAKFNRPVFKSRRWPYMDPLKDVEAAKAEIALRLSSRREKIEERGGTLEDVFHDNLEDEKYAEEIGLSLQPPDPEPEKVIGEDEGGGTAPSGEKKPKGKEPAPRALPTADDNGRQQPLTLTINNHIPTNPTSETREIIVKQEPAVVNVKNEFHMPEAPKPERQEPTSVTVNVPPQPPPVVNVNVPRMNATLTLDRDADGKLSGGKVK